MVAKISPYNIQAKIPSRSEIKLPIHFQALVHLLGNPPELTNHYAQAIEDYWGARGDMMFGLMQDTVATFTQDDDFNCSPVTWPIIIGGSYTHAFPRTTTKSAHTCVFSFTTYDMDIRVLAKNLSLPEAAAMLMRRSFTNILHRPSWATEAANVWYGSDDPVYTMPHDRELIDWLENAFRKTWSWLRLTKELLGIPTTIKKIRGTSESLPATDKLEILIGLLIQKEFPAYNAQAILPWNMSSRLNGRLELVLSDTGKRRFGKIENDFYALAQQLVLISMASADDTAKLNIKLHEASMHEESK